MKPTNFEKYQMARNKYRNALFFIINETLPALEELNQYVYSENICSEVKHGLETRIDMAIADWQHWPN